MSLDFNLEIETQMSVEDAINLISRIDGFKRTDDDKGVYADGMICSVSKIPSDGYYEKVHQEIMQESFGFSPTLRFSYRPDSYELYEIGMRNGLKAFLTVLQEDDGDAACILNGDSVKFARIKGKLLINPESFSEDEEGIWRFKDIPFKEYELKNLALSE